MPEIRDGYPGAGKGREKLQPGKKGSHKKGKIIHQEEGGDDSMELEEIRQFMKENGISMEEVPDETLGKAEEEVHVDFGKDEMEIYYSEA